MTSSLPPGEVATSVSTAHSDATRSASSASSRCAASSGDSPSTSSSPAGISQSRLRSGCRYCLIRNARSSSSRASTPTAPVWSTYSRTISWPPNSKAARRMSQTRPSKTRSLARTGTSTDWSASGSIRSPTVVRSSSAIVDIEQEARLLPFECGADESAEQRVRVVRAAAQLGVRLSAHVERMHVAGQLDELDEVPVGRHARERHAGVGDAVAVRVVHLVAVAMALGDLGRAVELGCDGAVGELGRVEAEAHRAAEVAACDDLDLLLHRRDDRELRVGIELAR